MRTLCLCAVILVTPGLIHATPDPAEIRELLQTVALPPGVAPENSWVRWIRIAQFESKPRDPELRRISAEMKKVAELAVVRLRTGGPGVLMHDLEECLAEQITQVTGLASGVLLGTGIGIRHLSSWRGMAEEDTLLLLNRSGQDWRDTLVGVTLWDRNGSRWVHVHPVTRWVSGETIRFHYPYQRRNASPPGAKGAPDEPARVEVSVFLPNGVVQQTLVWGEPEWEGFLRSGPLRNARFTYSVDHGQGRLHLLLDGVSMIPGANLTFRITGANREITWRGLSQIQGRELVTLSAPELGSIRPGEIHRAEIVLSFDSNAARVPVPAYMASSVNQQIR